MIEKLTAAVALVLALAGCAQWEPNTPESGGAPYTWPCQATG